MDEGNDRIETLASLAETVYLGESAARTVATGGEPDLEHLDRMAEGLDVLRRGIAEGTLDAGWLRPTEDDVRAARRFAQLAREHAPLDALVELARRVHGVTANPGALSQLSYVLPWLAGEATHIAYRSGTPHPDEVRQTLDMAAAFFERGGDVAGFVPTPDDLARVLRLRDIATVDDGAALAERCRLAKELWARLPQDNITACVRRAVMASE